MVFKISLTWCRFLIYRPAVSKQYYTRGCDVHSLLHDTAQLYVGSVKQTLYNFPTIYSGLLPFGSLHQGHYTRSCILFWVITGTKTDTRTPPHTHSTTTQPFTQDLEKDSFLHSTTRDGVSGYALANNALSANT